MKHATDSANRRRLERMPLGTTTRGLLGGHEVRLLDLSLEGTAIEHDMPFSTGRSATLEFRMMETTVRIHSQITRCRLARRENGRVIYRSALAFGPDDEGLRAVRSVMAALVTAEIEAMRHERTAVSA